MRKLAAPAAARYLTALVQGLPACRQQAVVDRVPRQRVAEAIAAAGLGLDQLLAHQFFEVAGHLTV
jgi:hypothetical protein